MDHEQSISKQTQVTITLATHLLINKFPNSNVVFSPFSIHAILSILAAGSNGPSRDQLLAFLKANTTDELNSLYSHFVPLIFAKGSSNYEPQLSVAGNSSDGSELSVDGDSSDGSELSVDGDSSDGPQLSVANGVWVDKTLSFKPSFKEAVDTVYKAACNQVDFRAKGVENEVNLWAEEQTNGLIKQVIPANAINNFTRLIIANAFYFKGTWSEEFDESCTEEDDFHLLDGTKVQVPFMTSEEDQFVCEHDDFKVLGLPYFQGEDDEREFTMYFFLPDAKDGLQSLIEKMNSTSDFIEDHIPWREAKVGEFLIPKFKISIGFEASSVLKEMGLVLPFSDENDFTEMVESYVGESVNVCGIYHKSFVEVNEEGTEAAAVSVGLMTGAARRSTPPKEVNFVADHPFLFVIREDVTGVVLFMGQVIDPSVG